MKIGVVGLGLIGGSIAKAISKNTEHTVLGLDRDREVVLRAKLTEAIDGELTEAELRDCDLVIIALYPHATIDFVREHAEEFKPGAIVTDCCGIKREVCEGIRPIAAAHPFTYVGAHPMAGAEFSGFDYSKESLFERAAMILTPDSSVGIEVMDTLKKLFLALGFRSITIATPEEHDRMIAYTSQLAHVLSSAYIKSEAAEKHRGFSAGSFKDMTRVARLNEQMWTELFLENRDNLLSEVRGLIQNLQSYADALESRDEAALFALLKEGRERKAMIDGEEA